MTHQRAPLADRFHARHVPVPWSGCWLWTGRTQSAGYGVIQREGRESSRVTAHRLSWELHHGMIPNGLWVLHTCDVRACVNPDHLFLGTCQDNHDDMNSKGRGRPPEPLPGEANPAAKLTTASVVTMRAERKAGASTYELAARYRVSRRTVGRVLGGERWSHVADAS